MEIEIHTARMWRLIHRKIMGGRTCFPIHYVSPKQKGTLCMRRTLPLFPLVNRECEQDDSLCGSNNKNCPTWEWARPNGRTPSWESGENLSSSPHNIKMKSPLVEWARGKGLAVLPHPPLLSNNCPQLTNNISLNGWLTHGKLPMAPMD